jgi:hypothetical protein
MPSPNPPPVLLSGAEWKEIMVDEMGIRKR